MDDTDSHQSVRFSSSQASLDSEDSISLNNNNYGDSVTTASISPEKECISKIIKVLDLDDSNESKMIAEELRIGGRQALRDHEEDIVPSLFSKQMSEDQSELLDILKVYIEQQWKERTTTEEWFHEFLRRQKSESTAMYDQILTRTAEYGSKFMKNNALLSITLQLLFEFDDATMEDNKTFNQLWNTMTSEGRQGIQHYKEDFASKVLKEQLENDHSALYNALKGYFYKPLNILFENSKININDTDAFKIALDCVINCGWWKGLHDEKVTELITGETYDILIEKLKEYLNQQGLRIPDPECEMIKMCMNEYVKLQLSDLVESGELIYVDQKFDHVLDTIIEDYRSKKNFSSFMNACLIPIMYLLKRHQNLDDFVDSLFRKYSKAYSSVSKAKLSIRMMIHILLLNSDLSLSRKIMSLLSKRNPIPFLQPSIKDNLKSYEFVSDIIHVWDYSRPTLLSFGIGPCYGKSTIINTIFLSSFEQSMSSIYFQNTIDIDFGYSFLPRRSTNIADAHGSMMKTTLEQIHELFDGFLIHVEYKYLLNNINSFLDLFNVVRSGSKYRLLIIRDVPIDKHDQCFTFISSQLPDVETSILPDISVQNSREIRNLIFTLRDTIWEKIPTECQHDASFIKNELKNLIDQEYKKDLDQMYKIIVPLEQVLFQVANNENMITRYFPEYLKFVELCSLKLQLARFNFYGNEKDAVVYDVRRKIFELEKSSETTTTHPSRVYTLFLNILNAPNMLTCLDLLIAELKQERERIVSTADMAVELPLEKKLSLEVLWRNAIICSQHESEQIQKDLQQKYYEYIQAGSPFEIVDGDNFYFQYSFLFETLQPFRNHRTLVISIIGPQNSGKSTLLNYMFGTLFDVRDGRCTRGIYGSFVKTNRKDFDYIMLIDTEGLLGIEREEDPEYDRRIVLFCLAVSHLVIVNITGEVSTTLQQMLTLCTDSLSKMGVTHIPQPTVHFILNQKADLNIENNQAAIDKIIDGVKKLGLGDSILIQKETFHTLPSAFKKEGHTLTSNSESPNAIKTAPEFIECVQSLCGKIIRSAEPCLARANEFFYPLQWLSSSKTIFDTIEKFPDLTYYRDIHERRLDNEIREHIQSELTKVFSAGYRNELIIECTHKTEEEVDDLFLIKKNKIQETSRENVENLFKLLKVPDTLRKRTQQFLTVQITEMFNALRTAASAVNEREKVKLIVQNGEGDLQTLIENIIQSGQQMSSDVASQRFELMFNNTVQSIRSRFVPEKRLNQAIRHIYTNYNIYEKECLLEFQDIIHHLSLLSNFNESQTSIDQVEDKLIVEFSKLGYRGDSVRVQHFNPTTLYSLDMIRNLVYLSKDLLERKFVAVNPPPESFSDKNQLKDSDQFQFDVRDAISKRKPIDLQAPTLNESDMYFGITKVFKEVMLRINRAMQGVGTVEVRQIRTELIQKIVGLINSLTIDINNELSPFCLSLSRPLKSLFHSCAVILLTKYYYDEQMNHFSQTLVELQTKKEYLKKYFINMVVPNAAVDENYAINLGKQLKEHLVQLLVDDGQGIINTQLINYECLNRKWIQDRCDGRLLTHENIQWYLDYIENPIKIIEQFFNDQWSIFQKEADIELIGRKSFYVNLLKEFFSCIQSLLDKMERLGAAATLVNDIFIAEETNSLDANENLINKKRCMAILLHQYFTRNIIPVSLTHNAKTYNLKTEAFNAFQLVLEQQKPSAELSNITQQLSSIFDRISIGNLIVFLQALLKEKDELINDLNGTKSDFKSIDNQDTYARLVDKVRGCPDLCPCCKRPCDVDHTQIKLKPGSKYNEHRCLSGHALRAMNGYKFEVTQEASLLMCEQIKDDNIIVVGSRRYQWSQFKREHPDWIFDSALDKTELNRLHGKFLTIWGKIGQKLCDEYGMKYVTHNAVKDIQKVVHEAYHFILLLDASASMGAGERWDHLMEAVQEFLRRRRELQTDDRITIIVFADEIDMSIKDQDIHHVDVQLIKYLDGGTSFSSAFAGVHAWITALEQKIHKNSVDKNIAIVFMTDGEDDTFPGKELDHLLEAHKTAIKKFWTLALTDECTTIDTLEKINDKMKGSFYDIETSTGLIQAYAEVATSTAIKQK